MSNTKHTQGEWCISPKNDTIVGVTRISPSSGKKQFQQLADVCCILGGDMTEEARANAHLIAAAPKMLEALEYALERIKDFDNKGDSLIESAIKAAKGE